MTHLIPLHLDGKAFELRQEREAVARLEQAIATIQSDMHWYWRWGDGSGGYVLGLLAAAARSNGEPWPFDFQETRVQKKDKIGRKLSKQVMERDAFRCGTYIDLCCDHIIPESKGGPTTFENLQTMCRPCNTHKGNRI